MSIYEYHYDNDYRVEIDTSEVWSNDETVVDNWSLRLYHHEALIFEQDEYSEPDFEYYEREGVARYLASQGYLHPDLQRDTLTKERDELVAAIARINTTIRDYRPSVADSLAAVLAVPLDDLLDEIGTRTSVYSADPNDAQPRLTWLQIRLSYLLNCYDQRNRYQTELNRVLAKLSVLPMNHADHITQLLCDHD